MTRIVEKEYMHSIHILKFYKCYFMIYYFMATIKCNSIKCTNIQNIVQIFFFDITF